MVKDPVCGMKISEEAAATKLVYQGQSYYFCSTLCKQLFEREPQKYAPPAESLQEIPSS